MGAPVADTLRQVSASVQTVAAATADWLRERILTDGTSVVASSALAAADWSATCLRTGFLTKPHPAWPDLHRRDAGATLRVPGTGGPVWTRNIFARRRRR
jgi:hypothetical protein